MSWQGYVDNLLAQNCVSAGIFGFQGEPWHDMSKNGSINASQAQVLELIKIIKGGAGFGKLQLGNDTFSELNVDTDNFVMVKRRSEDKDGKYLCYASLGKSFVMVAMKGGADERKVTDSVEKLKDYINGNI